MVVRGISRGILCVHQNNGMKRALSHSRIYPGEKQATPLLRWLNAYATREQVRRIKSLANDFLELNELTKRPVKKARTIVELCGQIGKVLRRYRLRPMMVLPGPGETWSSRWVSRGALECAPSNLLRPLAEGDSAVVVLALAELRLIDRVRQCERPSCREWYFARFRHQRFCTTGSSGCQEQFYKSQEGRDERARKAQAYRNYHGQRGGRIDLARKAKG